MNKKYLLSLSLVFSIVPQLAHAELIISDKKYSKPISTQAAPAKTTIHSVTLATTDSSLSLQNKNNKEDSKKVIKYKYKNNITESGKKPLSIQSSGWGNDIPLRLALRQIVPVDFEISENGVQLKNNVSWSGDKPWVETLNEFSNQSDFIANVNWDKKEVTLAPNIAPPNLPAPNITTSITKISTTSDNVPDTSNTSVESTSIRSNSIESETTVETVIKEKEVVAKEPFNPHSKDDFDNTKFKTSETYNKQTFVASKATIPVVETPKGWVLNPSLTLRENIQLWGEKAGWRVVWDASDYPIIASATFHGDFASPSGPIAQIIDAYELSDQPLVASLTTMDKVLHVKNKYHIRQEVVQPSPQEISPKLYDAPKQ